MFCVEMHVWAQHFFSVLLQIAISNPNREVLLTLTKAGVVELIGKEWYFVRVHDAVQVCLRHVQSLDQTPKSPDPLSDGKPSFFHRLLKQREDDLSIAKLESGDKKSSIYKNTDPQAEPLLSWKSWIQFILLMNIWCQFLSWQCLYMNIYHMIHLAGKVWLFSCKASLL